jgi:hypothetical protein
MTFSSTLLSTCHLQESSHIVEDEVEEENKWVK